MADSLHFSLVSPERELFGGDVHSVQVPGVEGLFTVLPDHAPTMSTLSPGMLLIHGTDGSETSFYVRGGFADVAAGALSVLAEVAIPANELNDDVIDAERKTVRAAADASGTPEELLNADRADIALASR